MVEDLNTPFSLLSVGRRSRAIPSQPRDEDISVAKSPLTLRRWDPPSTSAPNFCYEGCLRISSPPTEAGSTDFSLYADARSVYFV